MSEEKKLAVLIDSDNVSAKYAQFIMQEVVKYGVPTYKRVYGDWEKGGNGWHNPAINYSIMPVQQTSYIAGKNATDFSMIIDAMDILYTGRVDGFVLVTSDSDFTRLAIRLREAGMLVVGIGELKTPRAFTASCNHFCYLNQVCTPDEGMADEKTIRKAVLDFVTDNKDERLDLAKISAVLTSKFGNINFDELGYKRFSGFIDSFPELRRSNTFVTLKKKREEKPAPAPLPAGAPTEQDIKAAIADYFKENAPTRDNMMKIESYITGIYGIVDYSRFGSKRFAKFIDKLDGYTRNGTDIAPAALEKPAAAENDEKTAPAAPVLTMEGFAAEVSEYAAENSPAGGNAGQLNNLLISKYGKDYFRRLGFGDFKKALASLPQFRVENNRVFVAAAAENEAQPEKRTETASAIEPPHEKPAMGAVSELVLGYAGDNMPDGGNLGQLNNELMARFGKGYLAELGFEDIKSMLAQIKDTTVRRNHVFLTDAKYSEYVDSVLAAAQKKAQESVSQEKEIPAEQPAESTPAEPEVQQEEAPAENAKPAADEAFAEEKPVKKRRRRKTKSEQPEEKPAQEEAAPAETNAPAETKSPAAETETPAEAKPVPDMNGVKRDVISFAFSDEDRALSRLGTIMTEKYGKGWLKSLGVSTIKKLLSGLKAVSVKGDKVVISEEFAKQTEEIEKFVSDYARSDGSRSVRALSTQLKKRFEGFDIADYGFARFTDFVNAIDGVKADRYHVSPEE